MTQSRFRKPSVSRSPDQYPVSLLTCLIRDKRRRAGTLPSCSPLAKGNTPFQSAGPRETVRNGDCHHLLTMPAARASRAQGSMLAAVKASCLPSSGNYVRTPHPCSIRSRGVICQSLRIWSSSPTPGRPRLVRPATFPLVSAPTGPTPRASLVCGSCPSSLPG